MSDWFVIKTARRNRGIYEPEQRLWLFSVPTVLVPAALILWGVGVSWPVYNLQQLNKTNNVSTQAAHQIHWFGLIFAMCVLAACNAAGITLSIAYLVDSYHEISGDGMTSIIIIRNTMSFAIGYGITPWLNGLGLEKCFISVAFVGLAISAVFIPVLIWGKKLRNFNRLSYWREVKKRTSDSE